MLLHSVTLVLLHTQAQKTADTHQPTNNHNNQIVIKISFGPKFSSFMLNFKSQINTNNLDFLDYKGYVDTHKVNPFLVLYIRLNSYPSC